MVINDTSHSSRATFIDNKAIRDGRPRPPRYYIPLHFYTNPESLRPFVPEIWPNNVFNLSATYDLDLWPKIRNMYAKFHNDRLRNGWDITLWNFAKTRTNTQTHKQTDMGITIPRPPPMGGEVITLTRLAPLQGITHSTGPIVTILNDWITPIVGELFTRTHNKIRR